MIEPTKPPQISDDQARDLLAVNNLQTAKSPHDSKKFILILSAIVILVVVIGLVLSSQNHSSPQSSTSAPTLPSMNPAKNSLTSGSIDAQVKYCSNPINAQLTC
jgi:hypothetical protein